MPNPHQAARDQALLLACTAAATDDWMTPANDGSAAANYTEFVLKHRETWEQTDHFTYFYGRPLANLAYDNLDTDDTEAAAYLYEELLDVFWDEWEERVNLYAKWERKNQ